MAAGAKTTFPNDAVTLIEQSDGSKAMQTVATTGGTTVIGTVSINQATPGTTNKVAVDGSDSTNALIGTQNVPVAVATYAWSVAQSSALETSRVVKATPGVLRNLTMRLDATAPNGTYYLQILNAASLPGDGAVTMLYVPIKRIHASGVDDYISIDFTQNGIFASTGVVVCLSTTEFTKTISGAYLSIGAEYK